MSQKTELFGNHGPLKRTWNQLRHHHPTFPVICQRLLRALGYSYCWKCRQVLCTDLFPRSRDHVGPRCKQCVAAAHSDRQDGQLPASYESPEQRARRFRELAALTH